jgi:hypothetical protein
MESITIDKVKINAKIGANLYNCILDAIELSVSEKRIVELIHNDRLYKIDHDQLVGIVENAFTVEKATNSHKE